MIDPLDMLDLVVTQIKTAKFGERLEALDVRNQIVVEFELLQGRCQFFREFDGLY